ncbi:protein nervous wreck isoform X2 [Phlebotomus argentipes]|uniref:protein nervous wreck isoform X2 n=1 Tax=Phlebotomus argentipes TaxID=94469 RepID=UPI002892F279|nr:protein nervous wreck isoform X2 [Phlebotomus argentipes]
MQPPPRKGNYTKFLKNLHAEQVAKLHLKNQHECDLLEDIRLFTIKRSAIEKSYSEALLKISSAYLNKKMPNIPDIKMEGTEEKWNMWSVWRTVLEENEKLARARLAAIEVFQQQIADEAKMLRDYKLAISKKCVNQLANIQKEVQNTVMRVDTTKKQYFDEEHSAHDVRDKARDIEEKLKKKKGSFFQSITSLQKNSARVTSRKEQLEERSSGARNDYLLSLASANAHQNRYFTVDLQTTMTTMENYVYERIADYLMLMGRTELLTCSATQHSFGKIRDQAQQLTREYNLQCCYLFYPVLKQHIQYEFENCENDPITKITAEHESAAANLSREAKIMASRIVRENTNIKEYVKKLAICQALRDAGQRVDPQDPHGVDLETKMEDFRECVRKAETEKAKAEACIESLRQGGVNVDEWMQEAETLGIQEIHRSNSELSMRTDASGQGEQPSSDSFYDSDGEEVQQQQQPKISQPSTSQAVVTAVDQEEELSQAESVPDHADVDAMLEQERQKIEQLTAGWDDPTQVDWGAEGAGSAVPAQTGPVFKCTALYSYTAQNPDELTIVENEQLEVIGEGDGDGWLRARNYRGEEGYVPHNYLDVERDELSDSSQQQALATQISFSSVDYTVDNEEPDAYQDSAQSPDQVSVISAPVKPKPTPGIMYCIALYDYDATAEDELTFEEGQIIKITTKSAHGVDDGWWEGELDGKHGNFPSLVVEECDENGDPLTEGEEEPEDSPMTPPSAPEALRQLPVPAPPPTFEAFSSYDTEPDQAPPPSQPPPQPPQNLDMDFSKGHPKQYGAGPPPVLVLEPEGESSGDTTRDAGDGSGLNVVHVTVTAATPMAEHPEMTFPPVEEDVEAEEAEEAEAKESKSPETPPKAEEKEEGEEEEKDLPPPPPQVDESEELDDFGEDLPPPSEKPPDAIPPPESDPFGADGQFEANFEADFSANFEDAFAGDPEPPKQVVGGRASIPEELAPHQLERLQNLKESNA